MSMTNRKLYNLTIDDTGPALPFLTFSIVASTGREIHKQVKKLFRGSLAIRVVTAGSTNACEQELVALGNAYYDVERFGVHNVIPVHYQIPGDPPSPDTILCSLLEILNDLNGKEIKEK